jgi:hypothetical protein
VDLVRVQIAAADKSAAILTEPLTLSMDAHADPASRNLPVPCDGRAALPRRAEGDDINP